MDRLQIKNKKKDWLQLEYKKAKELFYKHSGSPIVVFNATPEEWIDIIKCFPMRKLSASWQTEHFWYFKYQNQKNWIIFWSYRSYNSTRILSIASDKELIFRFLNYRSKLDHQKEGVSE